MRELIASIIELAVIIGLTMLSRSPRMTGTISELGLTFAIFGSLAMFILVIQTFSVTRSE